MNVELVYITLVGICQFYNDIETIATTNSVLIFNSNRQSRSFVTRRTMQNDEQGVS